MYFLYIWLDIEFVCCIILFLNSEPRRDNPFSGRYVFCRNLYFHVSIEIIWKHLNVIVLFIFHLGFLVKQIILNKIKENEDKVECVFIFNTRLKFYLHFSLCVCLVEDILHVLKENSILFGYFRHLKTIIQSNYQESEPTFFIRKK